MIDRSYLLKISLLYIEPEIWRRFVVPASIPLDQLHVIIQIVMGWDSSHLFAFLELKKKKRYIQDPEFEEDGLECGDYGLGDLIKRKGQKLIYVYDFGDFWEHQLVLEDSRYENAELKNEVACLEGERACPPEDVGGVYGYYDFCKAWADPKHKEHDNYVEWLGQDHDPGKFEILDANLALKKFYG